MGSENREDSQSIEEIAHVCSSKMKNLDIEIFRLANILYG